LLELPLVDPPVELAWLADALPVELPPPLEPARVEPLLAAPELPLEELFAEVPVLEPPLPEEATPVLPVDPPEVVVVAGKLPQAKPPPRMGRQISGSGQAGVAPGVQLLPA
jgi:hypothetical protein